MFEILMIFGPHLTYKIQFRKIDDAAREIHHHLTPEDNCLYIYEKTSRRDYTFSDANQLITNLTKKPSTSNSCELEHKKKAILNCSKTLSLLLHPNWLKAATLVPIPPSKAVGDKDYDDRMEQVCRGIKGNLDVRNLVIQQTSMVASHERIGRSRITPEELMALSS